MDRTTFHRHFEILLEMDPNSLDGATELKTLAEWDSLAILSFLAFADREFKAQVSGQAVVQCATVDDLAALVSVK